MRLPWLTWGFAKPKRRNSSCTCPKLVCENCVADVATRYFVSLR
jgi:hypothetical protein